MWSAFRASLTKDLKTAFRTCGLQNLGNFPQDIPALASPHGCASRTPTTHTPAFPSSQQCLTWLASCFRHLPIQPLARPHQLQALAAADACAEDDMVGVGGWAIASSQAWNMQDIRAVWPCLVKPGQRYIACFETLAQLAAATLVVGTTRLACLQARTIPPRKQALTNCSRPPGRCNSLCN